MSLYNVCKGFLVVLLGEIFGVSCVFFWGWGGCRCLFGGFWWCL